MSADIINNLSNDIHIMPDDRILRLNTLNNRKLYLKYKKGTKTFDDIKNFLFNDFKYMCNDYNDQSIYDFNIGGNLLSEIFKQTDMLTDILADSVSESDKDKLSSELLDLITLTNTNLNLTINFNKIANANRQSLNSEYDNISELFADSCPDNLFVKTLGSKTLSFKCDIDKLTVRDIKVAVCVRENVSIGDLRLIYSGKQLDGDKTPLSEFKIKTESQLTMVLRLRGGMFNEVSGRNGNYEPLQDIFYDLDSGFECLINIISQSQSCTNNKIKSIVI